MNQQNTGIFTDSQLTGSFFQNVISINILKLTMTSQPPVVLDLVVGIDFLSDSSSASFYFVSSTVVFGHFLMAKISNDRHKLNVDSLSLSLDHC